MKKVQLTQNKYAIIDDCDYDRVIEKTWCCHKSKRKQVDDVYYAATSVRVNGKCKTIHMHRLITNAPIGKDIDHVNNNGLDNRRFNLKVCSRSENLIKQRKRANCSSKYLGVSLHNCGKWDARFKRTYIGLFTTELEAHKAVIKYKCHL